MQTRPVTPRREPAQPGPRAGRPGAPERRRPSQPADPAPAQSARPGLFSLRSWRVRNRLTLLVLLPLLAAVGLAAARINTLYQDETHFSNAHFEAQTTTSVEQVLLALQQERLAASVCLTVMQPCTMAAADARAQQNQADQQNLNLKPLLESYVTAYTDAQQAATTAITQVSTVANQVISNASFNPNLRAAATEAFGRVTDLGEIRKVATGSPVQSGLMFRAYSSIIDDVIAVIGQTSSDTSDALVAQDNSALVALDNLVESESIAQLYTQEVIANGQIGGNGPNPDPVEAKVQAVNLNQAIALQTSAQSAFLNVGAPSLVQSFQATVSGPDITAAQAAVARVLSILQGSASWQSSSSQLGPAIVDESLPATVGDLRTVQGTAIQQMITDSGTLLTNAQSDLYKNVAMIVIALLLSFLGIAVVARSLVGPLQALRTGALDIAANRLPEVVRRLRDADNFDAEAAVDPIPINSNDEIGQVARAFDEVHQQAVRLASEQALLRSNVNSMFVNLSRRSQSLVQRQLRLIDELENSEQDPDQLANLFKLDHLATRMRRNGENLLVLAGEEPGRKWSQAVRLLDVMRAGASEVEQYERVALRDLPDVNVLGRVVNDLVHLVAELLENATSFSAPETKVSVTANMLNTGGVMLEIEDAGIGMTPEELDDANERLANPPVIDVAISRRMGLYVVGRLATRHGIQVRLRRSAGGGITALVLVPSTLLAGADGEAQAPTPELSATGARSLGALPRRGAGQASFPEQEGSVDIAAFPAEGAGAPPYRGAAPSGFGTAPAGPSSGSPTGVGNAPSGLSNGDQFADLPPFGGGPTPPNGPDVLPRRGETRDSGPAPSPTIPGARTPFEDRPGMASGLDALLDPDATTQFPPISSGRPGSAPDEPGPFPSFGGGRDAESERPGRGRDGSGQDSSGQFDIQGLRSEPGPATGPGAGVSRPGGGRGQDSGSTGQIPRIQDPSSTGQFPRIQDPSSAGQFPRAKDPAPTGQFPRVPSPDTAPQFPGPATERPDAAAPGSRPQDPATTGQFPRVQDPAGQGPGSSGRFPAAPQEPGFPGPAFPPSGPAPSSTAPADAPAAQAMPPAPPAMSAHAPSELDLPQAAPLLPTSSPTAVERLFAQDPLPPAPATDERLPIFEAMESEWFRRRDEARAQAALAQSNTVLPPLPTMPPPVAPAPSPARGSGGSSISNGTGPISAPSPATTSATASATTSSAPAPTTGSSSNGTGAKVDAVKFDLGSTGTSTSSPVSSPAAPTPSAPSVPAPSAPVAAQAPAASASAPAPAASAAPPASASVGLPVQPLATAPATAEKPAADSRGASPMENTSAAWSSPGDEGWKAAQAAAKPVAAGLTTKGLPKRVPRSNLVPGSAGGSGAAKATPPVIPPRSADAVRGRLSSFHQGLRQGRDAASTDHEPGQDGNNDD
ncbi:nitrate- and nitrite sensing domain-containing protein [Actinocrinis sp.]|uniref:nitrate- and nitrite sensing domain-containing protein n=1 Tax=Actinocrinis sp. TaxID=1920516 RepID=UPI002D127EC6|nr:nitrate- and nitrite sensing domain-containing protein [Actinocrinis sp.]HXR69460.1 nitrate- and nitrite sensing domain-containing protein [Actinocrinis sp.]